jgi:hypothetical protein
MKRIKVSIRAGEKIRGIVRLRQRDTAIVFTLTDGRKIEVDLMESEAGTLLLRSHDGAVTVSPRHQTLEVTTV